MAPAGAAEPTCRTKGAIWSCTMVALTRRGLAKAVVRSWEHRGDSHRNDAVAELWGPGHGRGDGEAARAKQGGRNRSRRDPVTPAHLAVPTPNQVLEQMAPAWRVFQVHGFTSPRR